MMSRAMPVPIFQIPNTQISSPFEDLEENNAMFNLKLSFLENGISDSQNKRLLSNKESELQFENLFGENRKKLKSRFRQNSKLCKPYNCSKKIITNSDDENFWRAAMNHFASNEDQKKKSKIEESSKIANTEKDYDSEDMSDENIFYGNITVTIKDKPTVESKEEILEILRKTFEAFKINAQESRRLRELKTKVQEKVALKRMKRCFDAWRNRVSSLKFLEKRKKEEREMSNERKIELFINAITEKQKQLKRLRKSTSSSSPRSVKPGGNQRCKSAPEEVTDDSLTSKRNFSKASLRGLYKSNSQTRLQAQKKIIEEQRFKLAQQNKIIEDLRLKEIEREAKKSHKETIDATKSAFLHCGRGTKRSLISLLKEHDCRDEFAETLRVPNTPDFLIRMEARAEARRERVKKSEEARIKRIEDEKKKEEEARKREEIERKRLQLEAQKEAKRLREEREEKRIREIERAKFLNEKADHFYRHFLLQRYIFQPLVLLLLEKRKFLEKAISHHDENIVKKAFLAWKRKTDQERTIKEELALSVYERNLLWSSFSIWKNYSLQERRKYDTASDFHDLKVEAKIFKLWWMRTLEMKSLREENERLARDHCERKMKARFFHLWTRFPEISEEVKKSERQKKEWRELVQRVIPDFDPRHRGVAIDD